MIHLISSVLYPRMKAGVELSPEDKEYIRDEIKGYLIDHATLISSHEPGTIGANSKTRRRASTTKTSSIEA